MCEVRRELSGVDKNEILCDKPENNFNSFVSYQNTKRNIIGFQNEKRKEKNRINDSFVEILFMSWLIERKFFNSKFRFFFLLIPFKFIFMNNFFS